MRDTYDTTYDLELQLVETNTKQQDDLDIPLSMFDILNVCREYSLLGWQIQSQVEQIVDLGIEDAILSKAVAVSSLPHIRAFLQQVIRNPLFGDAADQAQECVMLIDAYQDKHPITSNAAN